MKKLTKTPRTKLATLSKTDSPLAQVEQEQLQRVRGAMYMSIPPWGGPNDGVFDDIF